MLDPSIQTTTVRKRRASAPVSFQKREVQAVDPIQGEETLVRDARAGLRPAEQVESKLMSVLKHALVPVSQIRLRDCSRVRSRC